MEKRKKRISLILLIILIISVVMVKQPSREIKAAFVAKHYDIREDGGSWDGTYYTLNNEVIKDAFFCDGTYTYFLQSDGKPMKDRLSYHPDGEHIIYFDSEGHEVFSDFANVKKTIAGDEVDDYCYFDVYGYMYVDVVTYDKTGTKLYYVNAYGVIEMGEWFKFSENVTWADGRDGTEFAGQYGCANEDGSLVVNTRTKDWDGKLCYLQGNGVADYNVNARYYQFPIIRTPHEKEYYNNYSNKKMGWGLVRNTNHEPIKCDSSVALADYDAWYVDTRATEDDKVLYLTFDCGYENGYTGRILDILAAEDVPACFFVTQTYIRDNIGLTQRMKAEGHQVGCHTITHPSLPTKSYEEIEREICGCAEYMKANTGYDMDPYLRPPYGEYSERTLAITHDLGFKTIFWSIGYVDYNVNKQPGAGYVIDHFNTNHHNGAIILMHAVSSSNCEALQMVIQNMKAEGYRFASLNELQ
ncbi:MAG: polysaccharide deacetylase family protein [Lachnospiraceae bacterium]|nr:polysaccharide deacetylase family protein [Lachnospiraceae bacterium]